MTNSYRPIPAPDYVSGLTSQYRRDSQNLANLQNAMRRNDQRRVQVAGQGMELIGALANFSATAASKYQQVKEKREAERKGEIFTALNQVGATPQDIKLFNDNAYKIKEEGIDESKLEKRVDPIIREVLNKYEKPSDIIHLSEYSISQAKLNLPGEWDRYKADFGYDPSLPFEKRQDIFNEFLTKGNEKVKSLIERYGIQDSSSEALISGGFFEHKNEFFAAVNNKAAKENSAARDALLQEQRNLTLKNHIQTGSGGKHFVDELKLLGKEYSDGDFKAGLQIAKPIMKKRLLAALANNDISVDDLNNLLDDEVGRGDTVGELQDLYFNEKDRDDFSEAIQAKRIEQSEAIDKKNKAERILTEETSMATADSFITEGKIDEAKTELNNAYTALYGKGIKSTKLEQKIASLDFTTENLNAERKELQAKLLDGQLSSEELNKAYYPNKVEFQDEVEKLERIKNTVEYKNNQKSIKALMQDELVVSGNDSFFRGYGASIHADLLRRYRKNILMNEASPAEAAAEVEQHYKINGGGIEGVNKGLKYSFNTNDKTHTAYGNQLGVGVRNLSIINKRNNIQNQLQSGKKIDQIQFFSKGEVEDIIENYQTTGKLNDFARGSLHGIENKIEIINATAKSYGIDDEIEEPEGQEEFLNNLNPKDRTLINYMGIENLDVEILNRIVLYN